MPQLSSFGFRTDLDNQRLGMEPKSSVRNLKAFAFWRSTVWYKTGAMKADSGKIEAVIAWKQTSKVFGLSLYFSYSERMSSTFLFIFPLQKECQTLLFYFPLAERMLQNPGSQKRRFFQPNRFADASEVDQKQNHLIS